MVTWHFWYRCHCHLLSYSAIPAMKSHEQQQLFLLPLTERAEPATLVTSCVPRAELTARPLSPLLVLDNAAQGRSQLSGQGLVLSLCRGGAARCPRWPPV